MFPVKFCTVPLTVLTQVGYGVGVDVSRERLLPLDAGVGNRAVIQSKALQFSRFTGQLPVHLHGRLVQDFSEETGRIGNCGRQTETDCGYMMNMSEMLQT